MVHSDTYSHRPTQSHIYDFPRICKRTPYLNTTLLKSVIEWSVVFYECLDFPFNGFSSLRALVEIYKVICVNKSPAPWEINVQ